MTKGQAYAMGIYKSAMEKQYVSPNEKFGNVQGSPLRNVGPIPKLRGTLKPLLAKSSQQLQAQLYSGHLGSNPLNNYYSNQASRNLSSIHPNMGISAGSQLRLNPSQIYDNSQHYQRKYMSVLQK